MSDDMPIDEFLIRKLPRTLLWTQWAERDALDLERAGLAIAAIENKLFDGLPANAHPADTMRLLRERGYARTSAGTRAIVVAVMVGSERGTERGKAAAAAKHAEAHRFG